jgi:hypothetical protein
VTNTSLSLEKGGAARKSNELVKMIISMAARLDPYPRFASGLTDN